MSPFFIVFILLFLTTTVRSIGVNYGTVGDNLPPPSQVAQFLKTQTTIDRIKIFDANPEILRAFADTGILVAVTVPNGQIPELTDADNARSWVLSNISPFYPSTKINYVFVGTEVLHWGPQNLVDNLVPAMRTLHQALVGLNITDIKVTTSHSLGILLSSDPPSLARFRPGWDTGVLAPLLQFHSETNSPFVVNPYPYFGFSPDDASFSLFRPNKGHHDKFSRRTYGNMFDLLVDAVYVSMMRLGYKDVDIVAGETGWASDGDPSERLKCSPENAEAYNGGLVRKYESGRGTPLMPRKKVEIYLFALFDEDQKGGLPSEKHFGLFRPDFSPVYDAGLLRTKDSASPVQPAPRPAPSTDPPQQGGGGVKKWCVPKADASESVLQGNLDYVCSQGGIDCEPIQPGGPCFDPNTVRSHSAFVMNAFYQKNGQHDFDCYFDGTGVVTYSDPSTASCEYAAA